MNRSRARAAISLALAAGLPAVDVPRPPDKPNVVIIVTDDFGYADMGFTGLKEVATPHLDALATNGVRFSQGYASSGICSPARAGLITGRYQQRWGHDDNACADLALTESTIGDRMKKLGYVTGMIGKWHLGDTPELLPNRRGFDEVFHPAGNAVYFGAKILDSLKGPTVQPSVDKRAYTTEMNSARAADFITRHKGQPFSLYLAFNNVHGPLEVPQSYIDRVTTPVSNPKRKTMLGMILAQDDAVGVVMKTLRETGLESNTLVVLINDNGSYGYLVKEGICDQTPFKGGKSSLWDGGIRVAFVMQWTARWPKAVVYDQPVIGLDVVPTVIAAAGGAIDPAWKLDGVNLLPYVDGTATGAPHEALFWRMTERKQAVRMGDWKMMISDGRHALYNVTKDPGEMTDLARQEPARLADMRARYDRWAADLPPARTEETVKAPTTSPRNEE